MIASARASRGRRIIASELTGNLKLIVRSKGWVDITPHDYENGADARPVNGWEFDVRGTYSSAQELIDSIAGDTYVFSRNLDDYYILDGSLRSSAMVDDDNETPMEGQIEAWKRGEENLYIADMFLSVEVGSESHDITDEEAEMFGFTLG